MMGSLAQHCASPVLASPRSFQEATRCRKAGLPASHNEAVSPGRLCAIQQGGVTFGGLTGAGSAPPVSDGVLVQQARRAVRASEVAVVIRARPHGGVPPRSRRQRLAPWERHLTPQRCHRAPVTEPAREGSLLRQLSSQDSLEAVSRCSAPEPASQWTLRPTHCILLPTGSAVIFQAENNCISCQVLCLCGGISRHASSTCCLSDGTGHT